MRNTPGEFRAELHDRLFAPLYPFVFVLMAFATLGQPRTTRQNRSFAIGILIFAILAIRIGGFGFSTVSGARPSAILGQYLLLAAASAGSIWMILRGVIIDSPVGLSGLAASLFGRLAALRAR